MNILVSVIVNCFNQGHYLERAVKSVLSQTYSNIECLIVDDGSTDNTRQVAEDLMALDGRVKYFYKDNGGLPSARNFGVKKVQGEWIQCLDADDWIHEDKIRFQLSYLPEDSEYTNIVLYSDYERVIINANEQIMERQNNTIGFLNQEQFTQRLLVPDFLAGTPHPALQQAMLMHKSIFKHTSFPETLKALGDRYFAIDILRKDAKFIYTPIVGAYYTKHQTNRTNNWEYMKKYYISFYELVNKTYPELNKLCHTGLDFLLDEAIRDKEQDNYQRILRIIPTPARILNNSLQLNNKASIHIFNLIRLITPNFVLYEKYRGPRSQTIISIFKKRILKS